MLGKRSPSGAEDSWTLFTAPLTLSRIGWEVKGWLVWLENVGRINQASSTHLLTPLSGEATRLSTESMAVLPAPDSCSMEQTLRPSPSPAPLPVWGQKTVSFRCLVLGSTKASSGVTFVSKNGDNLISYLQTLWSFFPPFRIWGDLEGYRLQSHCQASTTHHQHNSNCYD